MRNIILYALMMTVMLYAGYSSGVIDDPLLISTAIGLSGVIFSHTILMIDAIGTDKNAPGMPQIIDQNNNDSRITTELTPRLSLRILGPIMFPITI